MKTLFQILSIVALAGLMIGCTESKEERIDQGSTTGTCTINMSNVNLHLEPGLNCNAAYGAQGLNVKVKTHNEEEFTQLKFTTEVGPVVDGSNAVIRFYRWQVNAGGTSTYLSPEPLDFTLERPIAPGVPVSGMTDNFSLAFLQDIADQSGGPTDMTEYVFIIRDTTLAYQVLRVALETADGTNITYVDVLIPAFYANPDVYSCTHAQVLTNLHPLLAYSGQGWQSVQFQSMGDDFCF
jgi:hypothetical protein